MTAASAETPSATTLSLSLIRLDGGTQSRAELSQSTIEEYAENIKQVLAAAPLTVFYDGDSYWLADGFHRWHGATKAGRKSVPAEVRQGTLREAVLYSVGANSSHGLRRTNADKRRAVELLLADEEWSKRSDNWVAQKCGVSHPFVGPIRKELVTVTSSTRIGLDGKERRLPTPREQATATEPDEPSELNFEEPAPEPKSSPRPSGSTWTCRSCGTDYPSSVGPPCLHCIEEPSAEKTDDEWDQRAAISELSDMFDDIMEETIARGMSFGPLKSKVQLWYRFIELKESK